DRRRDLRVTAIDQVEERVRRGGLVVPFPDLPQTDIVDNQQRWLRPCFQPLSVRAVSQPRVKVVEQINAARVADHVLLLACTSRQCHEDMALTRSAVAGEHQVVVASDEVEVPEFGDLSFVQARLEVPVEGFEGLVLLKAAQLDAARDAAFKLAPHFLPDDALNQARCTRTLLQRPRQQLVERVARVGQSEESEVSPDPFKDFVSVNGVAAATWFGGS